MCHFRPEPGWRITQRGRTCRSTHKTVIIRASLIISNSDLFVKRFVKNLLKRICTIFGENVRDGLFCRKQKGKDGGKAQMRRKKRGRSDRREGKSAFRREKNRNLPENVASVRPDVLK